MTEREFQDRVIGDLATIKERLGNYCEDTQGMKRSLYGPDGRGGLVAEVADLKNAQKWWNRGLALAQALAALGLGLVGLKK